MENFYDFCQEKVLPLGSKKLTKRELVGYVCWNETEIIQNLFGWQIRVEDGKHIFDCRSETEARYLRVFIEMGAREVFVPKDEAYLDEILPRLEYLRRRAEEVYDNRMKTVFSRKLREEVRRKFCRRVLTAPGKKKAEDSSIEEKEVA